jgi:DNA polymerase-4
VIIARVKSLFNKLYKKGQKVRLLGVRFSHLIPFNFQTNLFDQSGEKFQLYKTIDNIKNKFGRDMITKGSTAPKKPNKS